MLRTVTIALVVFASIYVTGCASTGAVPRPFPMPSPRERTANSGPTSTGEGSEPDRPAEGRVPPTARTPRLEAETPLPVGAVDGYVLAGAALQFRGTPYRLGGADPDSGFDCSGLVQYVYAQYGIPVPRDVRSQYHAGSKIDDERIQPGDLLFFATDGNAASHVGIAISSRQFVHAPNSNGVVRVEMRTSQYWSSRYLGARRIIE